MLGALCGAYIILVFIPYSGQKSQSLKQPNDSARHANAQPPTQKGSDAQSNPSGSQSKSARNQQTEAPDIKASKVRKCCFTPHLTTRVIFQ